MDKIDKRRNGREILSNLFFDIKDILDLTTSKKGRNNDGLKSKFAEFEAQLQIIKIDKIIKLDKEELQSIQTLKAKVQEVLD